MSVPHIVPPQRPTTGPGPAPLSSAAPYQLQLLLALAFLEAVWLWVLPLRSSFWLDELVTFWSAGKGVVPALSRSQLFMGQSMLYSGFIGAVVRIAGTSELALRLPSVLATALSAWLLFRLGERFFDREAGALVVVVFVSLHDVARQATNARPYGIALLLVVASVLQLVRWLDTGRRRDLAGFILLTAAIPYVHYLYAIFYLVLLAYALYVWRAERRVSARNLFAAAAFIVILLMPLAFITIRGHKLSSSLSWAATPDAVELVASLAPPAALAAGLFVGILVASFARRTPEFFRSSMPRPANVLFVCWFAIPILTFFLVSRVSPFKIFIVRYYLPALAALALLVGAWIRIFAAPRLRQILAICIALGSIASYAGFHPTQSPYREDWRGAAAAVRAANLSPTTPVLMRVGLIETDKISWDLNLDQSSPLLSPLSKYPVPGHVTLLPYRFSPESVAYLKEVFTRELSSADRFVLIAREDAPEFNAWMRGWFVGQGFDAAPLRQSKGVSAYLFRRHS